MTRETRPSIRLCSVTLSLVAAAMLLSGTLATAQTQKNPVSITPSATSTPNTWPIDQLLPLTVSDAWQMSGRNEEKFFDIVQELAAFSAQKRGLVLPESEAAGERAGKYIKIHAKEDHGQLLYAVVDQAVRHVGTKAAASN